MGENDKPRILIAGGGTGGHLYPGLSLAHELKKLRPEARIAFVGTPNGLERNLIPKEGYELFFLSVARGSPLYWRKPMNAVHFMRGFFQCNGLFNKFKPELVVALGGFAAAVPGIYAAWKKIPLVSLEQNVLPGRVTRLLSRWANQIHVQFEEAKEHLPNAKGEIIPSGSPARADILALHNQKREGGRLLVMGGSQGALRLNQIFCQAAADLLKQGIPITHITGTRDFEWLKAHYASIKGDLELLPYCENMSEVYSNTRLAVARAGASSINEFELAGIPSVLVPFPAARDDHQTVNARILEKAGASILVHEKGMNYELISQLVRDLWERPELIENMSAAAHSRAKPQAASLIAAKILELV